MVFVRKENYVAGKLILKTMTSEADLVSFFQDKSKSRGKVMRVSEESHVNRLPCAIFKLRDDLESKPSAKMDENNLKEMLFAYFATKVECYIDEIQAEFDQPRGYLSRILDEICDKKKIANKFVYNLKRIYKL